MKARTALVGVGIAVVAVVGFLLWNDSGPEKSQAQNEGHFVQHLQPNKLDKQSPRRSTGIRGRKVICRVGAPASLDAVEAISFKSGRFVVPPTIVGCEQDSPYGPIELVAYKTSQAFCFSVDRPRLGSSIGGECKTQGVSWSSFCPGHLCVTSVEGADADRRGGYRSTAVVGVLSPEVAKVSLVYGKQAAQRDHKAVVARISGRRMAKFHEKESFGVFGTVVPGCRSPQSVRVEAMNAEGEVLEAVRGKETFPHPCHP